MPGENLTRLEAQERKALVDVETYDIALDVTTGPETFRSATTVRFTGPLRNRRGATRPRGTR